MKGKVRHYSDKGHAKVDADSKIITNDAVTNAAVHDSQAFVGFMDETDRIVYLTDGQKEANGRKSRIRARIEQVFGFMTGSTNGMILRCIGKARAVFHIGRMNLGYSLCRSSTLQRQCHAPQAEVFRLLQEHYTAAMAVKMCPLKETGALFKLP